VVCLVTFVPGWQARREFDLTLAALDVAAVPSECRLGPPLARHSHWIHQGTTPQVSVKAVAAMPNKADPIRLLSSPTKSVRF
jgi:hypothetical protein